MYVYPVEKHGEIRISLNGSIEIWMHRINNECKKFKITQYIGARTQFFLRILRGELKSIFRSIFLQTSWIFPLSFSYGQTFSHAIERNLKHSRISSEKESEGFIGDKFY